jgi:outer membrane protein insertion porin family
VIHLLLLFDVAKFPKGLAQRHSPYKGFRDSLKLMIRRAAQSTIKFFMALMLTCIAAPALLAQTNSIGSELLRRGNDVGGEFMGRRVTAVEIEIEGAAASPTNEMRALLVVAVGQPYSPVNINDSLYKLFGSGLVSSARVEAEAVGSDGVAIKFIVKPQARVDSILFEGEPIFSVNELRGRLNELDTGIKLTASAVSRGLDDLQAYYSERGFKNAHLTPEVRLDATGTRGTIVYTITPGEQAQIAKYTTSITGAHISLSDSKPAIAEGDPFTELAVQREIERIRQAYLLQDYLNVHINERITPGADNKTVNVNLDIETGPRIDVEMLGLDKAKGLKIDKDDKQKIFPFYSQGGIDEFTVEEGRLRLLDYLQRKGYFFAGVTTPDVPDISTTASKVSYTVEPGKKYRLTQINFEGISAIAATDLTSQLKSKTASVIPNVGFLPTFGTERGVTSNEMLRQDALLITKRLRELGYRHAEVEERRGIDPDSDKLIITFAATEGTRTYVEQVGVRGNSILTSDEIQKLLAVKPADPLVADEVRRNSDKILSAYNARGYAVAEVTAEIADLGSVDKQDRVRLIYNINEGNRVRIREVITRGVKNTDVGRIERDFYLFKKGQWLDADKTLETERVLYDTNAFSSVTINSEQAGQTTDGIEERNVTVNIIESKRNLLIYGGGFQFSRSAPKLPNLTFLHGLRGSAQITNTNWFGKLYTVSLLARVSQDEILGQASFQNPRPFGTNFPMLISLFSQRLAETSFSSNRYTALIQGERRLSSNMIVYASYNFERISLFDLKVSEVEIARNRQAIRLGRIGPSFVRDTRDNAFEPTQGTLTLGSFYVASKLLGGNEQYIKSTVEHSRYYPLNERKTLVYLAAGKLGFARPYGGRDTLPISERFFAGGSRDLRGFSFEEAGPKDLVTGLPVGGNSVVVINNELRFPIKGILGGAVFSDVGNVFRRVRDLRPGDLTVSFGVGFRVKTPIGPIRLDLARVILNRPGDAPQLKGHFSFGQTF